MISHAQIILLLLCKLLKNKSSDIKKQNNRTMITAINIRSNQTITQTINQPL